jgi:hypothetical protein
MNEAPGSEDDRLCEAADRNARNINGPGYWDVDENSAGIGRASQYGDYWRMAIRRENPFVGPCTVLVRLEARRGDLRSEAIKRGEQIAEQFAEGHIPELRAALLKYARSHARDQVGVEYVGSSVAEHFVDLLTVYRKRQDGETLAELHAGHHATLLIELCVEDLTVRLTKYRAQLLGRRSGDYGRARSNRSG